MDPKAILTLLLVLVLVLLLGFPHKQALRLRFGRWSQGVWEGRMFSKGHLSEHIIAVTNWGSFPLGTSREVEHHHNYFTKSQLLSSMLWGGGRRGGSCTHEFCTSSLPSLPGGQRKPWGRKTQVFVFETGKHACPSCRPPPGWGEQHKGRAPIVSAAFAFEVNSTSADQDASRLGPLTGKLTALHMQSKRAGAAVKLGLILGEKQRNGSQAVSNLGPSSATS